MANLPVDKSKRLVSVDAYRGFVMLLMVSGGFRFARALRESPEILGELQGTFLDGAWQRLWHTLAYQFSHVSWTGCSLWDLIQPSFMFLVGVSMPFSYSKRASAGQSTLRRFGHALWRSVVLVVLAVFLSSNGDEQTHFVFVNVLAQIGLGYAFVYLLWRWHPALQVVALAGILGGYWYYFYQYEMPASEYEQVKTYIAEETELDPDEELGQFTGIASHWNKHTNAAADVDRRLLNLFPRPGQPWQGQKFWINRGGYQTLNFIPSIATMLLGVMAGRLIRSGRTHGRKLLWLFVAGLVCFAVSMGVDTTIWPVQIAGLDWSFCPVVKRIWTPTWVLFSAGWAFWMLAAFYAVIDVRGATAWSWPLMVVGMNSITMYVMAQLMKPWVRDTLQTHFGRGIFEGPYGPVAQSAAVLFVLWLICVWLYRQRIFVRI